MSLHNLTLDELTLDELTKLIPDNILDKLLQNKYEQLCKENYILKTKLDYIESELERIQFCNECYCLIGDGEYRCAINKPYCTICELIWESDLCYKCLNKKKINCCGKELVSFE